MQKLSHTAERHGLENPSIAREAEPDRDTERLAQKLKVTKLHGYCT